MSSPLISVIMPVYNAASFVREAVESILAQTLGDFELIVIDDASTDGSREILASFTDPRCRVLTNATNLGPAETRNRGIAEARGEFLAFLDADDLAVPQRLARQVEWLRGHPSVGVLGSCIEHVDSAGKSLGIFDLSELDPRALRARLLFHNRLAQSSVMVRASALQGLCFRREFEPAEDYDLWVRLECDLVIMDETLVHYRIHEQSASAVRGAAMLRAVRAIHDIQLSRLGLTDFGDLHAATVAFDPITSFSLLEEMEHWLCSLRNANRAGERYAPRIFDHELSERWLVIGERARQLGVAGWNFWRQSLVHRAPFSTDLRLLARALRWEVACRIPPY